MKLKALVLAMFVLFATSACAMAADVAVTSVGQSSDGMMVRVILKSLKIGADFDAVMKADALTSQKVLIAVVGGSSKGLGAAGINKEDEVKRALDLCKAAEKKGMKILMMHVGGEGRRGPLSDYFISAAVPKGDALILVDGANKDKLFDGLVKPKKAKIYTAASVNTTKEPLKTVLASWGVTK